jgi:tyrosine aminotransferase
MVPGWRLGWVLIHDRNGIFDASVRGGLTKLSQLLVGPNTLVQSCLPTIMSPEFTKSDYNAKNIAMLQANAELLFGEINKAGQCPGLSMCMPQGAMYAMIAIDVDAFDGDVTSDVTLADAMFREQSLHVLPGQCFGIDNFFRVVLCPDTDSMKDVCSRIDEFCKKHKK